MPSITREDGVRFIIPSYRDTIVAKKSSLIKKEVLLLSTSYGEYITVQKKGLEQYEIAFSAEPGYLLGECIWQYFKRPVDLIYCEAIPNTAEAILVIVKGGTVYLDGSFPIDSIVEELVVFKTQQNNFEINLYGDLPIGEDENTGLFFFESASVKSFNRLDKPIFPTLPTIKAFQLLPVNAQLEAQGIGVLPIKPILMTILVVGLAWMAWTYLTSEKQTVVETFIAPTNPYQQYEADLSSPEPSDILAEIERRFEQVSTIPGWTVQDIEFNSGTGASGTLVFTMLSLGGQVQALLTWADRYHAASAIDPKAITISYELNLVKRRPSDDMMSIKNIVAILLDRLATITPGNVLQIAASAKKQNYSETSLTLAVEGLSPQTFILFGKQLNDLPLVLNKAVLRASNGKVAGSINLKALGN